MAEENEVDGVDTPPLFEVTDTDDPAISEPTPNHTASRKRRTLFNKREPIERAPRSRKAVPRRKGQFVAPLTNLYTSVGIMLMPFDPVCGNAVLQSAENCARALDDLAYQNDAVRRAIYALVQTSATGAVIAAHAPILMAVAVHHVPTVQKAMGEAGAKMAETVEAQLRASQPPGENS